MEYLIERIWENPWLLCWIGAAVLAVLVVWGLLELTVKVMDER